MNKIKLIVCDIEGVITPPNRGMISPGEMTPIVEYCRAVQRGGGLPPLVFCTGRQIPYAECVAQLTNAFFPGFPSVVENGAFLYDVARNEIFLNPAVTPETAEALREIRREAENLVARHGAKKEYGKEVCLSLNPPAGRAIEDFFETVRETLARFAGAVEITHSKSAVDITPAGVDKASGVRFLAEKTGIPLAEMLGVGDTRGDLPMLRIVGFPAAPSNATDDVKTVARYVAAKPGPAGVAEILRRFTSWE